MMLKKFHSQMYPSLSKAMQNWKSEFILIPQLQGRRRAKNDAFLTKDAKSKSSSVETRPTKRKTSSTDISPKVKAGSPFANIKLTKVRTTTEKSGEESILPSGIVSSSSSSRKDSKDILISSSSSPTVDRRTYGESLSEQPFILEGQIIFEYGLPAAGVSVILYNQDFGGAETLLGKGTTDEHGSYKMYYNPNGKVVNLEVRIADANEKEVSLSKTKFNASKQEVLNLVAPSNIRPLAAEYSQLVGNLEKQLGSINKLADAQEKGEHYDLSILHYDTGWDARLISLLAKATKLNAETDIQIEALYALFRLGLPTEKELLATVDFSVAERALDKAKETGIVNADFSIDDAKNAFARFALNTLRGSKAPGALSTTAELLKNSGLPPETNEMSTFENLYLTHRGSPAELWQRAKEKKISDDSIKKLRLQGKLAYLTLNNAPLISTLQDQIASSENLSKLVELDLYKEDAWKNRLNTMGASEEGGVGKLIPPAYGGKITNDPLGAYAADLARKVRLSFTTKVVEWMIKNGELEFSKDINDNDAVVGFLNKAEELGFQLGRVAIDAFVKKNKEYLFPADTSEEKIEATKENIKKLQRLYQITPSNESLNILLKEGFTSADDIIAFSKEDFLNSFCHLFSSVEEADLVYRKSQQVSAITHNVFTTARLMDSTPSIYAISSTVEERENTKKELIKHYPTMESLFGSLDFCECDHCRSVLSPAAYFVDLLKFLEPDDNGWKRFLEDWMKKHDNQTYMKDWNKDDKEKKPYHALIERRPDLPNLPLTCENTNTALPYIDLVNEIFEYYVAYGSLDNYKGDSPADTTTPALLAEPQNILPIAYDELRKARYPLALPFDLWLETVRLFFNHFGMPLWQVLKVFRSRDELFGLPSQPGIESPTNNTTNATVSVPDTSAPAFKMGSSVTYRDISTNKLHSEKKIIIGLINASGFKRYYW